MISKFRKKTVFTLNVNNSSSKSKTFTIRISNPNIKAPKQLIIGPNSEKMISLTYKPMHPETKTEKIGLISRECEQIWYEVKLKAIQAKPKELPLIVAEIGKFKEYFLTFKNPYHNKIVYFQSKWVKADGAGDIWSNSHKFESSLDSMSRELTCNIFYFSNLYS